MNCNEAIEYIHSLEKFGIKPGMERIEALCNALGNPQDELKIIHVAGTNGKGSTSTMISNILQKSGYNVGLFISPYVTDFRERIQYNGKMIEKSELAECVEKVKYAVEEISKHGLQPTEFEVVTATAFLYYKMKKCDFVVLEVGLGGRLDSTNIIKNSLVSVIVSISLDHTSILGNTIGEIAAEKSGIIKFGSRTVVYPFQDKITMDIIEETCDKQCNFLNIPDIDSLEIKEEKLDGTIAVYDGIEFKLPLAGKHMIYNACTAIEAIHSLSYYGIKISDEAVSTGIAISVMPARCELIKNNPVIILDGGHNEGCAEVLSDFIKKHLGDKRIIMVSSIMADKDYFSYLESVASLADEFIATKADVPRALSSDELMKSALAYCDNCYSIPSPFDALKKAISMMNSDDVMIVCGSFYLAGEIREKLLEM